MPIKGLRIEPSFPLLGRIKKGEPYGEEERAARKRLRELNYFRLDTDRPDVREKWNQLVGEKPTRLHIILPYAEMDRVWQYWLTEWDARGIVHRCDGETCVLWRKEDGTYSTDPKPCPYASGQKQRTPQAPGCVPEGRLRVLVREMLSKEAGFVGYFEVLTHSWTDIRNITSCLAAIVSEHGVRDLRMLECDLYRKETVTRYVDPKTKERRTSRHYAIYLEPNPDWVRRQLAMRRAELLALPMPEETVNPDTGEVEYRGILEEVSEEDIVPPTDVEVLDAEFEEEQPPHWAEDEANVAEIKKTIRSWGRACGIDNPDMLYMLPLCLPVEERESVRETLLTAQCSMEEAKKAIARYFLMELADSLCEEEYDFERDILPLIRKAKANKPSEAAKIVRDYFAKAGGAGK